MAYLWNYYVAESARFIVLTAATMMVTVVWNATLCGVMEINQRLRGTLRLHLQRGSRVPNTPVCVYLCVYIKKRVSIGA